jgi:hypothetical protein
MFRVTIGALMSFIDLCTDIYVGYMFYSEGRMDYFELIATMVGVSILIQLLMVVIQYRNIGIFR